MLIEKNLSQLLVIDMQERLLPAMATPRAAADHCRILMKAAQELDIPVTLSEQYPKGLGPTSENLLSLPGLVPPLEKLAFSCWRDPALNQRLTGVDRRQILLAGIETHVCVLQSALDLAKAGFTVFVVADATSSRREENRDLALERMRQNGVTVISTEMAIFEWLERAGTTQFKSLSKLIK
jgi:nicotinamidase-related amidase